MGDRPILAAFFGNVPDQPVRHSGLKSEPEFPNERECPKLGKSHSDHRQLRACYHSGTLKPALRAIDSINHLLSEAS